MKATTAIEIVIVCLAIFFVSYPTIDWWPFKITFEKPYLGIAMILIILGSAFLIAHGHMEGYKKGLDKGFELRQKVSEQGVEKTIEEYNQNQ